MKKSLARLLALLTLPALVAAAFAQTPADSIVPNPDLRASLEIWSWEGGTGALAAADAAFAEYYPNIEITYVNRPTGDNYQQIQLGAVAGGGLPDVANIENSHLRQFVELGILVDMTDRLAPYVPLMNAFKWREAEMDGRYYAMPNDSGPVAHFYRRDVFEQAGVNADDIQTWADYYEAAKVIKAATGLPMWQQATARNNARLFEILMWQRGTGYIDADGNVILDRDENTLQILEFMGRFWQEELAVDAEEWTDAWYRNFDAPGVASHPGAVWTCLPDFKTASAAWIHAGGAHHAGFSLDLTPEHLEDFADMAGIELVVIDRDTRLRAFRRDLRLGDLAYGLAQRLRS
jgi:lactose/L-arabinose transport system substrate-binding protein